MTGLRPRVWNPMFAAAKERLREPLWWFPFPLFIGIGLALLLTAHVLFGTSPRIGHPADIITFPSETKPDGAIWLSMTPIGDEIVVTTGDRKVFRWPQNARSLDDLKGLRAYLKAVVAREIESAALVGKAYEHQTSAVIAADQRLKFLHVRPLLYAFAEAGIAHYAFETQNPRVAMAEPEHGEGHGEGRGESHGEGPDGEHATAPHPH